MRKTIRTKIIPRADRGSSGEARADAGIRRVSTGLFGIKANRTTIGQEVLAGLVGWQTVASSFALYASVFVAEEEGMDKDESFEAFLLVAGLSTLAFGVAFNLPFIVAPSVLYTARSAETTVGGHLAAQAIASVAAALFLALTLRFRFMSLIPTALRLGAGCGISMLVGVLGLRGVGLLVADSFELRPLTWQSCVGLGIIAAACCRAPRTNRTKKWLCVLFVPMVLTMLVYAADDPSKFQGYRSAESASLSWSTASFGAIDFSEIRKHQRRYWLYTVRTFLSVVVNIPSVLLMLIDGVSLEAAHTRRIPLGKTGFPEAIQGTRKAAQFNLHYMACAILLMSCVGNVVGVTTQAPFVESMILMFAGGATGLSSAVTGVMLIISVGLRPVIPVLVTPHVSGALAVVIMLRFLTAIRMIDVSRTGNLLLFGMSLMLIPFSFDFATVVCIAATLGYLCETIEKAFSRLGTDGDGMGSRGDAVRTGESRSQPDRETRGTTAWPGSGPKDRRPSLDLSINASGSHTAAPPVSPSSAVAAAVTLASPLPNQRRPSTGLPNSENTNPGASNFSQKSLRSGRQSSRSHGRSEPVRRMSSCTSGRAVTPPSVQSERATSLPSAPSVHWSLAAVAALVLVLSRILDSS